MGDGGRQPGRPGAVLLSCVVTVEGVAGVVTRGAGLGGLCVLVQAGAGRKHQHTGADQERLLHDHRIVSLPCPSDNQRAGRRVAFRALGNR